MRPTVTGQGEGGTSPKPHSGRDSKPVSGETYHSGATPTPAPDEVPVALSPDNEDYRFIAEFQKGVLEDLSYMLALATRARDRARMVLFLSVLLNIFLLTGYIYD